MRRIHMAKTITHGKRERVNAKGVKYHISTRCNNREKLINNDEKAEKFMSFIEKSKDKFGFLLNDLSLMMSHVHLIIDLNAASNISEIMHSINRRYARWYNERYERKGHFWEDRFYGELIKDDMQLLASMRYAELNPVRANLCKSPLDWKYSGARFYLKGEPNKLLDAPEIYMALGKTPKERQNAYSNIFPFNLKNLI
jgi:putative transposase